MDAYWATMETAVGIGGAGQQWRKQFMNTVAQVGQVGTGVVFGGCSTAGSDISGHETAVVAPGCLA